MTTGKLTVITGEEPEILGKVFSLKAGKLEKETAGYLNSGWYEIREFSSASDVVDLLQNVSTSQAITSSLPVERFPDTGRVVARKLLADNPDALTRTKVDMRFKSGTPGLLAIDYDPPVSGEVMDRDALWTLLQETIAGLQDAGVIYWLSGSSHVWHGDKELQGRRGQRLYIMVADAGDIPRASAVLADKLWLAGLGRAVVSKGGSVLLRHIFDDCMGQDSGRLDFVGGAYCHPPLSQRRGAPHILSDGGFLDTRKALPDLCPLDGGKIAGLKEAAKAAAEPEAAAVKEALVIARGGVTAKRLIAKGVAPAEAHERGIQAARAAFGGVLLGDSSIVLESGDEVTIGAVLDDRGRYHGQCCRDPLEPDYLGHKIVGRLYLHGATPTLHSFAHGGATYKLHRQPARLYLQSGRRAETANEIRDKLADEPDLFIRAGVLTRVDDGKLTAIVKPASLAYLVSLRLALYRKLKDGGDQPVDLDGDTTNYLFAALEI